MAQSPRISTTAAQSSPDSTKEVFYQQYNTFQKFLQAVTQQPIACKTSIESTSLQVN